MTGWIKLHRSIEENEFYFEERFTRAQAWMDLLLLATHIPKHLCIRGIAIDLKPGELCWSQLNLAARWQWNFKTVVKFFNQLKMHQMAEIRTNNVTTVITIKNWAKYQDYGAQSGDQKGERAETKTETNKNEKNLKNYFKCSPENFSKPETGEKENGNYQNQDPSSVKSRLSYRYDPEKSRRRYEELRKLFGDD